MKRAYLAVLVLALAGVLAFAGAPAFAQVQRAPVPVSLPHPPPVTNPTSSVLFDAMLAISRAQQSNPRAAQTASFQYTKAVQQYHAGDRNGARQSALEALSTASQPLMQSETPAPSPSALLAPGRTQLPGTQGGLYGADAPEIDADSFLALARGTLDDCAARHDRSLATAQRHYAQAARDFAAGNWQATRLDAKAAIDACARPR